MSSSKKTTYYNLSQFQDTDKPSWRGDYNGDMDKIDTGLQSVKTTAIDAKTAAQNAESSINEVKRDYLKKTDAQDTYATKTALNDTKTTIENNADSKFVAKTVYDTAIASKADKTSVYTKTESDGKYLTKTDIEKKEEYIVFIGDSYLTGFQPGGSSLPQVSTIGYATGYKLGKTPKVFANNSSGYAKQGVGGKTFATLAEEAKNATADIAEYVTDVVVAGGRNDDTDVSSQVDSIARTLHSAYPNARLHFMFLWDNNVITTTGATVLNSIKNTVNKIAGVGTAFFYNAAPFWGMTYPEYFCNNTDIHPNVNGVRYYSSLMSASISGTAGGVAANSGEITLSAPFNGKIKWNMNNGILSIIGKFSCTGNVESGTKICTLPNPFDLGDGFIMALINAGDTMGYLRLTRGNLEYIGANGGGDMTGNVWIPPVSWTAIRGL